MSAERSRGLRRTVPGWIAWSTITSSAGAVVQAAAVPKISCNADDAAEDDQRDVVGTRGCDADEFAKDRAAVV